MIYIVDKNYKLIVNVFVEDILDESLTYIRNNGLLICCSNKEYNLLFYDKAKILKDDITSIYLSFDFNEIENIYENCEYICFFCIYKNKKIEKIKISDIKSNTIKLVFKNV